MDVDPEDPGSLSAPPVVIAHHGEATPVAGPGELSLEDGTFREVDGTLPADLPLGYHTLRTLQGRDELRVIVAPRRCPLPLGPGWGWSVQLYAARSPSSWGIGDFADLRQVARWGARVGARMLLINPLHASSPLLPQQASPYSPSSRRFRNVLYLRVEEAPGARDAAVDLERLVAAGRALNAERRIDRDAVYRFKMEALELLWSRFGGDPRFDSYRKAQGTALAEFATYSALAERHGCGWQGWPAEFRQPGSAAVRRFVADNSDRIWFHCWLQWILDEQLAAAADGVAIMQDLAIGVHPDGADAWAWQDILAKAVSVGAPPDEFNSQGQDWGLPPFVPHRLRAAGYEPFIQTIRAALRHAGGLRIDHVMGLFRLFWIPNGLGPAAGGYVRYDADALLAIVALESTRAGAYVVGEDLGTVEAGVRERLAEQQMLSYRLFLFESDPPAMYPRQAMAAVTTHDLPTIAGLWTGSDIQAQEAVGFAANAAALRGMRNRLRSQTGLAEETAVPNVIEAVYRRLSEAGCLLVTATLEDALGVQERPNMPGTVTEWPNWSIALPVPIDALEHHPLARTLAAVLNARD